MLQVGGDSGIHAQFLAALTSSHSRTVVVKSYLDGVELGQVEVESGAVRVTSRSQVRRRATLAVTERQWTGLLSPFGVEVRAWVTISQGTRTFPPVPVFTGRVERRRRVRRSGLIAVECWDRFAAVNDDAFETPRNAPAGSSIPGAIGVLLKETHPDAVVSNTTGSTATVPAALAWDSGDGSRGLAVDKMALSIGAEVVALPDGNFLVRRYPSLNDAVSWAVATGPGGVIVEDAVEEARTAVANRWIITGAQAAGATTIRKVVTIATGALAYDGPYGRVVRTYSDPMISSDGQALDAANSLLARVEGLARQRTVTTIANPALEAGDVLAVTTEDGIELHIADDFALPLGVEPTMAITSRSTELG